MSIYLHSLATALPAYCLTQDEVKERAATIFGDAYPDFSRLKKTFDNAGVDRRYSVVPPSWFHNHHDWRDRNAEFLTSAKALFIEAAQATLDKAGWSAHEVDCVVTVCSTGIATPSLEARALTELGFKPSVMRVPVFGLGCAGGVSGLGIARRLAAGSPGAKVLMVAVETCSLAFRADRAEKADIISAALFADGAAGVALSDEEPADRRVITLGAGHQTTWPNTLDIMGWDVDGTGLGVMLDRSIPTFVEEAFAPAAQAAMQATGLMPDAIDRFVCHPGGAKVLVALEATMKLAAGSLDAERAILREVGNMSAPTVLFILKRVLENAEGHAQTMMACALGPGFTASFQSVHLEAVAPPWQTSPSAAARDAKLIPA
ncbi:MAG: type III polyketide synthase [Pseudomonadota bacterium]